MDWSIGWIAGVAAMAVLFALVGVLPLAHRSCGECRGDCGSCSLDDPAAARSGPDRGVFPDGSP